MARKSLENLCSKFEKIDLIGSFENAETSLEFIQLNSIELILLDIEMPGMSGLELMEKIPYLAFASSSKPTLVTSAKSPSEVPSARMSVKGTFVKFIKNKLHKDSSN